MSSKFQFKFNENLLDHKLISYSSIRVYNVNQIVQIFEVVGQSAASNGDDARPFLISSYVLSAIGVVAGIIGIVVLSVVLSRY